MIEHKKVFRFNQIAKLLQTEKVIFEENFQGFKSFASSELLKVLVR